MTVYVVPLLDVRCWRPWQYMELIEEELRKSAAARPRESGGRFVSRFDRLKDAFAADYAAGVPYRTLYRRYGLNGERLRAWLAKLGLPRRGRGEATA